LQEVVVNTVLRLVALTSLSALCLSPCFAQSRVGVTSASSGGPLGKPPAAAERVLHVGVDVQANEIVTTGATDRAHLLFLDGSSLTVGPQARLTIDRFVYDPNAKTGELAVNATQGVFRFVGGKISKTAPVTIRTPSASLTIRGGIMLVSVEPARTVATFMFGREMTVTANGQTRVVSRPGWQVVVAAGQVPGQAQAVPPGGLGPEFKQLEAIQAQPGSANPEEALMNSGFAGQNSGKGVGGPAPGFGGAANAATNAVNEAGTQLQKPSLPAGSPPVQQQQQNFRGNFSGGGG
jgi:hypothetical protein